mgnify:FL=1
MLTYLTIEIQQEALVRKLETFRRFLSVASVLDGQIANLSGVSREVGLGRSTVQGYFEVVVDTLLGSFLPSFRPRAKVKEVEHPKFYFFDPGVSRALTGEHRNPLSGEAKGHAFENFMIGQIRALDSYLRVGGQFSYWRTESGTEVDLVWHRGSKAIGFELKSSTRWRPEFGHGLKTLIHEKKIAAGFGVYLGKERLRVDGIDIYPATDLLKAIGKGLIHPGQ